MKGRTFPLGADCRMTEERFQQLRNTIAEQIGPATIIEILLELDRSRAREKEVERLTPGDLR